MTECAKSSAAAALLMSCAKLNESTTGCGCGVLEGQREPSEKETVSARSFTRMKSRGAVGFVSLSQEVSKIRGGKAGEGIHTSWCTRWK